MTGVRVFVSYSHADKRFRGGLVQALSLLQRQGLVELWTDHDILPGAGIDSEIREALEEADVVIPLVSAAFMGSDYCWGVEFQAALSRHGHGTRLLPVIVHPCEWEHTPLSYVKALPDDGRPISTFENRELAYKQIAIGVRKVVEDVLARREEAESSGAPTPGALGSVAGASGDISLTRLPKGPGARRASEWTLNEWEERFWQLYGSRCGEVPLYDTMLRLIADSTRIGEAMRKRDYVEAAPSLARVFGWLCVMTTTARVCEYRDLSPGLRLSDIVWRKYPAVCSVCHRPRCVCPASNIDGMSRDERERMREEMRIDLEIARFNNRRPGSLDEWVEMFHGIYGDAHSVRSSATKTFHFLEEVGEVEIELRAADLLRAGMSSGVSSDWAGEVADVFSWASSLYLHIRGYLRRAETFVNRFAVSDIGAGSIRMDFPALPRYSTLVWDQFKGEDGTLRCPDCHKNPCGCPRIPRR